ncbi:AraC family transcriptional regulator [Ectopseudomonas guguanensis]|uniref:AraC-type DNA-binding protein n=1 Tax=Ectopseudomonas guguanensis TaxID=1198456 RepID=A0A1H0W1F7_9GAMM|nr:AraC family transcriptional regulator [Pseudomonas guguanensis]SDP84391.1 AraC-type DNA-binding protein [Pseudomonas guguanensis]
MSVPWPARRSITSIQLLTQLGLDLGLSLDSCLHDTGLSPVQLASLNGEVEAQRELQLIANLIEALPDVDDLGLQAGRRYHLTTYGAWGYAILSSATVRQAADLGLRYHGLTYAFTRISLSLDDAIASLHFDDSALPPALHDFIVQRDMLGALVVVRELLGSALPLLALELRQPAPADVSPFAAFGQVPRFGAPGNRMGFAADLLDNPLPRANPHLVSACEQQCQALLARHQWHQGLAGRVRQLLLQSPGQIADMEQVSGRLHLSSRTLRRRLTEEGTSFRALQDEVRQALAEELLAAGGLSLEEIAERLGYGELSNFIHAFKRWKGITPGRYQRGS